MTVDKLVTGDIQADPHADLLVVVVRPRFGIIVVIEQTLRGYQEPILCSFAQVLLSFVRDLPSAPDGVIQHCIGR